MHVFAAPFKGTAPNASVLLGVEMRGRDLQLAAERQGVDVVSGDGREGQGRGGNTDSVAMTNLRPETKARIEQSGMRMLNRIELPPGRYQIRVAAHDSAAETSGRFCYDLDVPDFHKSAVQHERRGADVARPAAACRRCGPTNSSRGAARCRRSRIRSFPAERRDRVVRRGLRQRRRARRTRWTSRRR